LPFFKQKKSIRLKTKKTGTVDFVYLVFVPIFLINKIFNLRGIFGNRRAAVLNPGLTTLPPIQKLDFERIIIL
jgi:hypothetical protein